jgi:hypothetical protein
MKMLPPGNNRLNMHFFTSHRHNAAPVAQMKGLCPHSVFLNPAVLYVERISGYRENADFGDEHFHRPFFSVLTGTNT